VQPQHRPARPQPTPPPPHCSPSSRPLAVPTFTFCTTESRKANLLLIRLYDSKYVDGPYCELRMPLENYHEGLRQWKGEAVDEISIHKNWRKVGWLNKTVNYLVREREVDIQITPSKACTCDKTSNSPSNTSRYSTSPCCASPLVELTGHRQEAPPTPSRDPRRKAFGSDRGVFDCEFLGAAAVRRLTRSHCRGDGAADGEVSGQV
jgi:hypothetical protein